MDHTKKRMAEYNAIIKENNDLYRSMIKVLGISDCTFWILYALRESNTYLTQRDICSIIYIPKQTVNSALKKLEKDGYIELLAGADQRSKAVCLTKSGAALCEKTVDKVMDIECKAMDSLTPLEQETFIALFCKLTDSLKRDIIRR